jgi:hypothetical protein
MVQRREVAAGRKLESPAPNKADDPDLLEGFFCGSGLAADIRF